MISDDAHVNALGHHLIGSLALNSLQHEHGCAPMIVPVMFSLTQEEVGEIKPRL
ncbi:hypothetical protein [Segnochrobactrum spirostomi]|uniref:hypothetical protein n=1 Tax=Segnochrobactrum spirostomi TaxID=2608987 RepID=UPI0012948D3E|nr:hypothetical protein [Segnochrobactrum spirostomi]